MSRGRLIPSLNYRNKEFIDMHLPSDSLRNMDGIELYAASNLTDAQTNPAFIFFVSYQSTFFSETIRRTNRRGAYESTRGQTRFIFNLNDFSNVPQANQTRIPPDGDIAYIRVRGRYKDGTFSPLGPIVGVPSYDFFGVTAPVFTTIGTAPNLETNGVIPDVLGEGCMNFHLPYFSQTLNLQNISSAQGGSNLFFSCGAGMSPSILRPGENFTLTGSAVPEFFLGGEDGTPLFTIRCSLVNRG